MAAMAQIRFSPLSNTETFISRETHHQFLNQRSSSSPFFSSLPSNFTFSSTSGSSSSSSSLSLSLLQPRAVTPNVIVKPEFLDTGGNNNGFGGNSGDGDGNGGNGDGWDSGSGSSGDGESEDGSSSSGSFGILGIFLNGWRSRVAADPQFPFKVLMEEVVGVSSCVLGDMASRPNFGLNELDFVFSTLVVGSIMNFTLMYLLAPTMGSAASKLPSIFATCPQSHMFETSAAYSVLERFGTFVYKGTVFAAVGFAAGLAGTALSNGLISLRKKMDPGFETPNKAPPPILNALTWATHMGLSSNFRYQTLNGVEFLLAKGLPPVGFKASVIVLRCLNNVLGGVSFVVLARMTGSQKVDEKIPVIIGENELSMEEKVKLLEENDVFESSKADCK